MGWATPDFSPELVSAEKITYNFVLWGIGFGRGNYQFCTPELVSGVEITQFCTKELVSGAEITSFVPRNWDGVLKNKLRDFFVFLRSCVLG